MLNRVILMGRITQELELKQTPSGVSVLSFSVAVERRYSKQDEEKQTDFINCVAWRQQAEFISKYFGKGRMIAIEGSLRTRNYDDKNGVKHYVTEVFIDSVSFTGEKSGQSVRADGFTDAEINEMDRRAYAAQQASGEQPSVPIHGQNKPAESSTMGDLSDYEDILSDDGVPF